MQKLTRIGDVLVQRRVPVEIEPDQEYRAIGIRSFGRGIIYYPPTRGSELSKLRYFKFPPEALALSNIKAWEGAISLSSDSDAGLVASNRFLFYRPRADDVDIRYIYYYFLSEGGLRQIGQASPGSADRNRTLSMDSFERISIALPAIDEQRRIATKLDRAFTVAEQALDLRAHTQRLHGALLESLIKEAGKSGSCQPVRIGDILSIERIPVDVDLRREYVQIGIRSFGRGIFHRPPVNGDGWSKLRYFEIHPNRLVVSNIMAWEGAIAVSSENDSGAVGSSRFLSYVPAAGIDLGYLSAFFQSRQGRELIRKTSTGTVMRNQTLSIDDFESLMVPLPDSSTQKQVSRVLTSAGSASALALHEERIFTRLRRSLLNVAFSGQL
jgi:type I restriction enzyme S subunit